MSFQFLPEEYKAPAGSSRYMKLKDGENKIRILSQPILGWEDWIDNKPVRFKMDDKPVKAANPAKAIRHFWAMIVWNYAEEKIQILQITQARIRSAIEALCKDADWGAPYFYDIKISKKGQDIKTQYSVNPLPHREVSSSIVEAFNASPCNLEALFYNCDPFADGQEVFTMGIFKRPAMENAQNDFISSTQADELLTVLQYCDPDYKQQLLTSLKKSSSAIEDLYHLPKTLYDRVKAAVLKKRDEWQASTQDEDVFAVVG
jgi:hypothetical protein